IDEAVKNVFDQSSNPKAFRNVIEYFEGSNKVELDDRLSAAEVLKRVSAIRGFREQVEQLTLELEPELARGSSGDGVRAGVAEFILHALHCHNRLNRTARDAGVVYG
ncbi:MAG: magnesium chelatase, partial [Planctomycetaceae bacterium]|nr:magnesium chelatase [Planctomycetaceae bacterium]